ncbi:rhamnan synthesis F family protein [Candidatus Uabimicrobium sp. HlEnr_7]|uniref:rhamnan synthesis F family protein n=1 Tax=Candidatus Uabimicrobium helgolandensis TaxID=3095367 RepID=UPI0035572905
MMSKLRQKCAIFFVDQINLDIHHFIHKEPFYTAVISKKPCNSALLPKRTFFAADKPKRKQYLKIFKALLPIFHKRIEYIFVSSSAFFGLIRFIKKKFPHIPVVFLDSSGVKKIEFRNIIGLANVVITNRRNMLSQLNIEGHKFIIAEDLEISLLHSSIHQILKIAEKHKLSHIKDIAKSLNISQEKSFDYYYYWWNQYRKPIVGCNYFLLLEQYTAPESTTINTNKNPLISLIDKKQPYKVNYIPLAKTELSSSKIALHIHMYHLDLCEEICSYLKEPKQNIDIFITVTDHNNIENVQQCFLKYGKKVNIRVVENRGRNITAFFCYNQQHYQKYDLIAHVHTKKSSHFDKEASNSWRHFLFAHLIDDNMIESITTLFDQNPQLGLLFPDDPFLTGWSCAANKKIAIQLMRKIDSNYKIPNYIEFPVGTMFWTRYTAIYPLFELKLKCIDFPSEPIGTDGTLAHTIERIIPFVCESQGFYWETLKRIGIERKVCHFVQN